MRGRTRKDAVGVLCGLLVLSIACSTQQGVPADVDHSYTSVDFFPELKPICELPDSLIWSFQDGPDFYVYRATSPDRPAVGVGLYFGHFPSSHHPEFTESQAGEIAGTAITWRIGSSDATAESQLFREAIFIYPPHDSPKFDNPLQIHVWAYADSRAAMNRLVDALGKLTFEELERRSDHDIND